MNVASAAPFLDIFSVKAMTLITVLVVSFVTLSAWKINERIAGMRLFTVGLLSLSLGGVVGLARLAVRGNAILIACNVIMLAGMIAIVQGIRVFRGFAPLPVTAVAGLSTAVAVFFCRWMFVQNNFGMRVGVISAAFALLSIDAALSMFRQVPAGDRLIYWPTGFAFAFTAAYLGMRTVGALSGSYGPSFLSPVPIELISTICANVSYILCAFGMMIASNAQLRRETEKMALIDPLTSLPNRRSFWESLLAAEERALTADRKFGLIYLDLDEFKLINDMLGHDVGDDLLRSISAAMSGILRSGDCLARIGGDEFVVLVRDIQNQSEVAALAGRLKATVENSGIPGDFATPVRVSCGIAVFPGNSCSAHDAMREADAAMYRTKQRNRIAGKTTAPGPGTLVSAGSTGLPGRNKNVGARLSAETRTFQRRRTDQLRNPPRAPGRRFRPWSILPPVRQEPARFSWAKPLSWIGF